MNTTGLIKTSDIIKEVKYDMVDEVQEFSDSHTYHGLKMEIIYKNVFGSGRIVIIPLFESMKEII